jgi:DNA-binding transcriptional LysR family regulator
MPKKLPPLGALRAFEAASRHISFVRAAEELSVSPAAISHQIKLLEHWVGAKLFERAARGVSLSRAGQEYASGVREIFDRLISTSASLRKNRARKVVHIRAQFSLATSWLLPRVVRFNQANTDIEIQRPLSSAAGHRGLYPANINQRQIQSLCSTIAAGAIRVQPARVIADKAAAPYQRRHGNLASADLARLVR